MGSFKDPEDVTFQHLAVLGTPDSRAQFLSDDYAEKLERGEYPMKLLERLVRCRIAKALDEQLCVENVLASYTGHGSGSGDVI